MEVIELVPGELVRWRVVDGPPEWIGTTIDWRLSRRTTSSRSCCSPTRAGPSPWSSCYHCSTKWAVYLLSLKALVETGRARPRRTTCHQQLALSVTVWVGGPTLGGIPVVDLNDCLHSGGRTVHGSLVH